VGKKYFIGGAKSRINKTKNLLYVSKGLKPKTHKAGKVIINSIIEGSQTMNTKLIDLGFTRPTPNTSAYRRSTDWKKFSNENLKFALDVLSLHHSPFEADCANEIERRIMAGQWLDVSNPPPLSGNVPLLFHFFPFSLLWKQGRHGGG
jgi:hypothetical protein